MERKRDVKIASALLRIYNMLTCVLWFTRNVRHSPTGMQQFEGSQSAEQFLAIHSRCSKRVLPDFEHLVNNSVALKSCTKL